MYATKSQIAYIRVLADKQGKHTAARGGTGAVELYKQFLGKEPEYHFNLTLKEASDLISYAKAELGWDKPSPKRSKAVANYK